MLFLRRIAIIAFLASLSACAGLQQGAGPQTPAGGGPRSNPDNGASALPGAILPCTPSVTSRQASCTIAINLNLPPLSNPTTPASLIPGLHPDDLRSAYRLNASARGGTIAIVAAYDDPTAETDLAVYRLAFGLPLCTSLNGCFRKVNERGMKGLYPLPNLAWADEIALDLDVASAACPSCSLLLVEANSASIDDLGTGVDTAVALGAIAVSNSYYAPEWADEASEDSHYRHAGVAITASSGDAPQPFYPAASPYVTAVGGTTLSKAGAWQETPWPYGGTGCSAYEPRPQFQSDAACSTRSAVDVAAVADPQTGVAVFATTAGGWIVAGGTSIGAPLVAAAYALSGHPTGPSFAYAHVQDFHDIAPAGYDLITGLGSPNGVAGL